MLESDKPVLTAGDGMFQRDKRQDKYQCYFKAWQQTGQYTYGEAKLTHSIFRLPKFSFSKEYIRYIICAVYNNIHLSLKTSVFLGLIF